MRTEEELLNIRKPKWAIVDEDGKRVAVFKLKVAASQNLSRFRLNKYDNLEVIEIQDGTSRNTKNTEQK